MDKIFMQQAIDLAYRAEKDGNLPVGSLITLKDKVVAEGPSRVYQPKLENRSFVQMSQLSSKPVNTSIRLLICFTTSKAL